MIDWLPHRRIFADEIRYASDIEALVEIHAGGFRRGWSVDEFETLIALPPVDYTAYPNSNGFWSFVQRANARLRRGRG